MKTIKNTMLLVMFCMCGLNANSVVNHGNDTETIQISAETLKQEMDNDRHGVFVVNVLNKNTFKDCSIRGSVHVSSEHLQAYARKKLRKGRWDFDKKIVVYCASGDCPLSRYAVQQLKKLGFRQVSLFKGGMRDWKQKGYPIKGKARAGYLKG